MTATLRRHRVNATDAIVPWAIALIDGLVPTRRRMTLEADLLHIFVTQPHYTEVFFAGVISDLVQTLPVHDEMRMLSARILSVHPDQLGLTRGQSPKPPAATGALLPDGMPFGTQPLGAAAYADGDIEYAALADGLQPESAALIAFAADGWRAARLAMRTLRENAVLAAADSPIPDEDDGGRSLAADAGERMFGIVTDALRWAAHRRRFVYDHQVDGPHIRGVDQFLRDSCWAWTARAEQILAGAIDTHLERQIAADIRHESLT